MSAKKKADEPRHLNEISKGRVKYPRADWDFLVEETDRVLGLSLHDLEPGKNAVTMPLEVHGFLLSVIEAAVVLSGVQAIARARGNGEGGCDCDDVCSRFGGCDFSYGSINVCQDQQLIVCPGDA